jgi:KaiC domain protein
MPAASPSVIKRLARSAKLEEHAVRMKKCDRSARDLGGLPVVSDDDTEDDWFAQALAGDENRDGEAETTGDENGASSPGSDRPDGTDVDWDDEGVEDIDESVDTENRERSERSLEASGRPGDGAGGASPDDGAGDVPDDFGDFAAAFENAPAPGEASGGFDDEGFGDFGDGGEGFGSGGGGFDDEEFESDIPRVKVGIEGLDEMILGGVPERSLIAAIGSAGTGKTTVGLQFLSHALENGERCVYVTLEETSERIIDTADEKGWEFSTHVEAGDLAVVDLDPVEMANSLASISSDLPDLIAEFGASRLVLDSVSLLEMMYDRAPRRRSEVFEFSRSLKAAGVTTLVTSEASEDSPYNSRYGIIEYLADAVFVLQYVRPSDFRETRLAVEIQKIRDANHSRETKPYEITDEGISVYRQANIF